MEDIPLMRQLFLEARQADEIGNMRLALQKYSQFFRAYKDRWHVHRWMSLRLLTKKMQDNRNMPTSVDDDVATLKAIMEDKKELKLYRIEAAWTAAMVFNDRGMRRDEAVDCLREALELAENIPEQEKRHKVHSERSGEVALVSMEELISFTVYKCKLLLDMFTLSPLMAEAIQAEESGNKQIAAQKYFQAFQASYDCWDASRWLAFSFFTSMMRDRTMPTSLEDDVATLKAIMEDKKELKLYRIEAAWTAGVVLNDRAMRRDEAADYHREGMRLAENIPKQQKRHTVLALADESGAKTLKSMEELIPPIVEKIKNSLDDFASHTTFEGERRSYEELLQAHGGSKKMLLFGFGENGTSVDAADYFHRRSVGGDKCDYCGKSREELGVTLLDVCARCKKGYYCSRECQKKQWKAGHKSHCRKPDEFKPGDLLLLIGLKSRPELNGTMAQVIGEDPNNKGRWKIEVLSGLQTISVASEKMQHMRPLK